MERRAAGRGRLRLLTAAVPLGGLLALVLAAVALPAPVDGGKLLVAVALAGAMAAADMRPVLVGPRQKASLATVPALVAAFLLPPGLAAGACALGALAANAALGRRPRVLAYNAGAVTMAAAVAAAVGGLGGSTGAAAVSRAALGGLLFVLLTTILPALASAAQRDLTFAESVPNSIEDSWPQGVAMAAIAIVCAVLLLRAPWAALLPLGALPLVYRLNRQLERELEAGERLAHLLAAQRRFLTDVSHNVGNPLATIRTNLGLLGRAPLVGAQEQALADATSEAVRLSELFKRLRVLAETDDDMPLHASPLELADLAADLVRAFTGPAAARRVRVDRMVDGAAPVSGDEDLLRQAAANLVENAIRHSPAGGVVTIRVGTEQRQARFEVIDQGPGIEADRLAAIFERFSRGPGGGSGLGLAIARSVVERHGGSLVVNSEPGVGTRFSILLPGRAV